MDSAIGALSLLQTLSAELCLTTCPLLPAGDVIKVSVQGPQGGVALFYECRMHSDLV